MKLIKVGDGNLRPKQPHYNSVYDVRSLQRFIQNAEFSLAGGEFSDRELT